LIVVEKRVFEGKTHLVVPVVMAVGDRYMNGIWYPSEILSNTAKYWNMIPLVVYHPKMGSYGYISAQAPELWEKHRIGFVYNVQFLNGKLVGECWIDEEKARRVDERVIVSVQMRNKLEVSTGMWLDSKKDANGNEYVTSLIPDHLAVLPGEVGACSIADGCGLLARV
jgi:hypothetical protein